jgi:arginine decarboxylase
MARTRSQPTPHPVRSLTEVRGPVETPWTIERSRQVYQVGGWGHPYFSINDQGHVEVHPQPDVDRGATI